MANQACYEMSHERFVEKSKFLLLDRMRNKHVNVLLQTIKEIDEPFEVCPLYKLRKLELTEDDIESIECIYQMRLSHVLNDKNLIQGRYLIGHDVDWVLKCYKNASRDIKRFDTSRNFLRSAKVLDKQASKIRQSKTI